MKHENIHTNSEKILSNLEKNISMLTPLIICDHESEMKITLNDKLSDLKNSVSNPISTIKKCIKRSNAFNIYCKLAYEYRIKRAYIKRDGERLADIVEKARTFNPDRYASFPSYNTIVHDTCVPGYSTECSTCMRVLEVLAGSGNKWAYTERKKYI